MTDIWKGVAPELKWTAVDPCGRRCYYAEKPVLSDDEGYPQWVKSTSKSRYTPGSIIDLEGRDWQQACIERPEGL